MEMCFSSEKNMNRWRSLFCSPTLYNGNEGVSADTLVTLNVGEEAEFSSGASNQQHEGRVLLTSDTLAIKSTLTNALSSRKFRMLSDGHIWWERHVEKGKSGAASLRRSIFVADAHTCDLVKCFAKRAPLGTLGDMSYEYQLGLQTKQSSLIMCFAEETDLNTWLASVRDLVAKAPKLTVADSLVIPEAASDAADEGGDDENEADDQVYGASSHEEGEMDTFQGYLFKRNDLLLPKGFSPQAAFSKVYVVLRGGFFFLYYSQIESTSGVPPFVTVPMGEMIEVREATDAGMPENAFEIVTMEKVYTFCSTDEDSLTLWVEAISDLLEARETAVHKVGSHVASDNVVEKDDYVRAIKASISFSGGITMKSVNLYTGIVSWRDRFMVITPTSISYYSDAKDVYTPETAAINEVSLGNIIDIRTCNHSAEPRCAPLCAFEVTAYVQKGGDEDGSRVFIFESRSAELCVQWMEALAKATGKFEMVKDDTRSGFMKCVESKERMQQVATARAGAFAATSAGAGTALNRGANTGRGAGRGGVGRGGAGRGAAFSGRGKPKPKEPTDAEVEADIRAKAAASGAIPASGASRLAPGSSPSPAGPGSASGAGGRGAIPPGARPPPGRGGGAGRGRGFAAPSRKASIAPKPGAI
jgi:hypothetical protein